MEPDMSLCQWLANELWPETSAQQATVDRADAIIARVRAAPVPWLPPGEKPTEPGAYWWRRGAAYVPQPILVSRAHMLSEAWHEGVLVFWINGECHRVSDMPGQFSQRLPDAE